MKRDIHRWVRTGITTLIPAETFIDDLIEYIEDTGDPSLLAMTREQASTILKYIIKHFDQDRHKGVIYALKERIRICTLQGEYSLSQKRAKRMQVAEGRPT